MSRSHRHVMAIRYADTDAQGHVYFANYLTLFDEGTTAYLHAIGCPPATLTSLGVDVVFVDAHVTYLGRTFFEDRLAIDVAVQRVGTTSITFEVVARRLDAAGGSTDVARGTLVQVCVNARAPGTKVPVPLALRDAVATFERGSPAAT